MSGGLVLSTYSTICPQWTFRWNTNSYLKNSRYSNNDNNKINHNNVKTLASSSSEAEADSVVINGELKSGLLLEQVDKELSKGDDRAALSLVKDLQSKPGGLKAFGAAQQVPQRLYSLNELKLNGIETTSLLSPKDNTLGAIERNLLIAGLLGFISAWYAFDFGPEELLYISLGLFFVWTLDTVAFAGGLSSLVLDTIGHNISQKYHNRVIQHEAGHFLIAYMLGILPKGYTLSSLEAFQKEGSLNVQAGTVFVDFEFTEQALLKHSTTAMKESRFLDILDSMKPRLTLE